MWYNAKLYEHQTSEDKKREIDKKRVKNGLKPFYY